ncbi:MAG TPA: ferritin-like domain-containing protein [Chromobacteriaceae bacterium]|nr:ferritin-like domain-containing protein [Chromobacteriaceae bacterium]
MECVDLYPRIETALTCAEVGRKLSLTVALEADWQAQRLRRDNAAPLYRLPEAGRPLRPPLVSPSQVPKRSLATTEGHAALIHAIAHIEFNAINLALDAAWRFRDMPDAFIGDWLRIAAEEAGHFALLQQRLAEIGYAYGDFPAHDGLWSMTYKTDHDPLVRMALVPRVLEARGLDATPGIQRRLQSMGDHASVAILDVVLREEIGHVKVGNYWFAWLCQQRGLEPLATFRQLLADYGLEQYRGPYNLLARQQAGFSPKELEMLELALSAPH